MKFRFTKKWEASWNGHRIVVENWWDLLLRNGEELIIDGMPALKERKGSHLSCDLYGEIYDGGKIYKVHAHVGQLSLESRVGCHNFLDDKLIGGDVDK